MIPLTPRQHEILAFIIDCWNEGWLPANSDIARHFGFTKDSGTKAIGQLRRKGYLRDTARVALVAEVASDPYSYLEQ